LENPQTDYTKFENVDSYFPAAQTGVSVSEDTILALSAVWACVRIKSNTLASLPLQVFERTSDGKRLATDHPAYYLLHSEPNLNDTSFSFRQQLQANKDIKGNAYALIIRKGSQVPVELQPLNSGDVTVKKEGGKLLYTVEGKPVPQENILHFKGLTFDGVEGKGVVSAARESFEHALSLQAFGNKFFQNGAHLSGVLEHPGKLSADAAKRLQNSWNARYKGIQNAYSTAVLEEGMKFNPLAIPPQDAQYLEQIKAKIADVARLFGVPLHMLAELDGATFSNIEHQGIEFVVHTMRPELVQWEQELNRKLFRESEKGQFFCEFNLEGLLRGDSVARAAMYSALYQVGAISSNEIRQRENMNTTEGGDEKYRPLNMVPITETNNQEDNGNGTQGATP
jgi:HK97 family phage portal protein